RSLPSPSLFQPDLYWWNGSLAGRSLSKIEIPTQKPIRDRAHCGRRQEPRRPACIGIHRRRRNHRDSDRCERNGGPACRDWPSDRAMANSSQSVSKRPVRGSTRLNSVFYDLSSSVSRRPRSFARIALEKLSSKSTKCACLLKRPPPCSQSKSLHWRNLALAYDRTGGLFAYHGCAEICNFSVDLMKRALGEFIRWRKVLLKVAYFFLRAFDLIGRQGTKDPVYRFNFRHAMAKHQNVVSCVDGEANDFV